MYEHCDLSKVKPGQILAIPEGGGNWGSPKVSHRLLRVERSTATQVCCVDRDTGTGDWRFRKTDAKAVGENYLYAEIASPELIASVESQKQIVQRHRAARAGLADLDGRPLHALKLSLEQLEALAKAWQDVKAMAPTASAAC